MARYATAFPAGQTTQATDSVPAAGGYPGSGDPGLPGADVSFDTLAVDGGTGGIIPPVPPPTPPPPTDLEGFRIVTPSELFGAQSQSIPPPQWEPESFSTLSEMVDNVVFKAFVLLIFVGYCALVYYYRDAVAELLKSLRSKLYSEKLLEEQNHAFSQFLNAMIVTGILSFSVLSIRTATLFAHPEQLEGAPGWSIPMVPFSVVCVWFVIGIYQWIVMRTTAGIIRTPLFFDRLITLRRSLAAIGVIVSTPFVLLFALNDGPSAKNLFYLIAILIVIFILFFVFKTIRYFLEQKISFLYWILYLCAVEIFPISIFIALSMRYV